MKEKDLEIRDFVKICMNDSSLCQENYEWYKKCLEKANDTDEFYKLYFETNNIKIINSLAYGRLLQEVYFYEEFIKNVKNILLKADNYGSAPLASGRLKIGNSNCSFYFPNGCGNGETYWVVFNKNNEYRMAIHHLMNYVCYVEGKVAIYDYGKHVALDLEGNYHIYSFHGCVVFVEVSLK